MRAKSSRWSKWCGRMSPSSPPSSRCIWNSLPASRRLPTPRRKFFPASRAALSLSQIEPAAGRGVRRALEVANGEATLIDESYNANPASMAAALQVLGRTTVGPHGRRIAVLGDMLELGPASAALHRGLNEAIKANHIDLVYCCGPLMRNLWDALSTGKRGFYAESAAALEAQAVAAIRAGDTIMVKGSLGSKMKTIVNALER